MKKSALSLAVGGIILSGVFGYLAISGEITGKTFAHRFHPGQLRGGEYFIAVLRDSSPNEFRNANNLFWGMSGLSILVAGIGIYFFRDK
jgi:hypothetical protein